MPPLDEYQSKRDFDRSPEPRGRREKDAAPAARSFVIHRHEASRLHYDLRLEHDGVLKSWAVPRGFSYVPEEKRFAAHTEDHPLEYLNFEGAIPRELYGGGHMDKWDFGTYRTLKDADLARSIEDGKVELVLSGKRIHGEWHLVRMKDQDWILFKARDRFSRTADDPHYPFSIDLDRAAMKKIGRAPPKMKPKSSAQAFSDPDWVFELEFIGRRSLVTIDGDDVRIHDRSIKGQSASLQKTREELSRLRTDCARLDGVFVALDANNRPCLETLKQALAGASDATISYCAFDLLHYQRWTLSKMPLLDRKALLAAIIPKSANLAYVDHIVGEGTRLAQVAEKSALAGIIAKRALSTYKSGTSADWQRVSVDASRGDDSKGVVELLETSQADKSRFGRVKFSNRNKQYWPSGWTKGDLIDYYAQVAEYIVPYLNNRPVHLFRFPDGIEGKSFHHHDAPAHTPSWVETVEIERKGEKTTRYIVCKDRETLLYLANLGSIDLHTWHSRVGQLDTPDWFILDLDPDGSPFAHVVRVAREIGRTIRSLNLKPYLKTSGSKGLHITIPVLPHYSYAQVRTFAEGIARHVAFVLRDIATVERSKDKRQGKVYIDYLQNHRGQTIVPPYVVRPVPAASVSTPLDWDELSSERGVEEYNLTNVPARLARVGDLFRGTLDEAQDLLPAIDKFRELLRSGALGS